MSLEPRTRGRWGARAGRSFLAREILLPAEHLIHVQETAGVPMLLAAIAALAWANSPWSASYADLWSVELSLDLHVAQVSESLRDWINDLLLPGFFFVIGLEIKRELVRGELARLRRAAMPVLMAAGGVIVPAAIYLGVNAGGELHAWGVPVATDIAFALAILALLGNRVPPELKVLLLAFAAVDDIGGVAIIAGVYSSGLSWMALAAGAGLIGLMVAFRRIGFWQLSIYAICGTLFWFAIYLSGVHTTIAGVTLGLLAPAHALYGGEEFSRHVGRITDDIKSLEERHRALAVRAGPDSAEAQELETVDDRRAAQLGRLETFVYGSEAPTDRLNRLINPWVGYLVLPLFALANAGVPLTAGIAERAIGDRVAWGIALALLLGKPVGIATFALAADRLGLGRLPPALDWRHVMGISLLGGIGFTVALFIAGLAVGDPARVVSAKLAVLTASVIAGAAGYLFLRFAAPRA